ncbi:MAG TPA: endonuclease/exonuclease/phosphatase family protein [Alphaproteobacteria bacterium]|nr:endonuclease/exonuclease/phosphatase family protein [Alphaproteobacteria bacterium]
MRIATFNVESLDKSKGNGPSLEARIEVLAPQLQRAEADILCLQEVNAQKPDSSGPRVFAALESLVEAAGLSGYQVAATENREGTGPRDIHNLVTLSRYDILASGQVWHDLLTEPRHRYMSGEREGEEVNLAWDRPVLHTQIDIGRENPLHVFNLHLRAPLACPVPGGKADQFAWNTVTAWAEGFYMSEIKRAGQALELRAAIDGLFDEDAHALIAVAGDFNSEEHHTPVEILRGSEENTANGALAGRVMVPVEHALAADRRFTVIHQGRRQMLDHILVSRALLGRFRGSEIHNEALTDELVGYAAVGASPLSYHAPVVAVFDL